MNTVEIKHFPPPLPKPNARDALRQFVQSRLKDATGLTLTEFIMARRDPAGEISYRRIATEIVDLTGIDISHEAVRRWYDKAVKEAQALEEAAANKAIGEGAAAAEVDTAA